jgi:hypothetical protein
MGHRRPLSSAAAGGGSWHARQHVYRYLTRHDPRILSRPKSEACLDKIRSGGRSPQASAPNPSCTSAADQQATRHPDSRRGAGAPGQGAHLGLGRRRAGRRAPGAPRRGPRLRVRGLAGPDLPGHGLVHGHRGEPGLEPALVGRAQAAGGVARLPAGRPRPAQRAQAPVADLGRGLVRARRGRRAVRPHALAAAGRRRHRARVQPEHRRLGVGPRRAERVRDAVPARPARRGRDAVRRAPELAAPGRRPRPGRALGLRQGLERVHAPARRARDRGRRLARGPRPAPARGRRRRLPRDLRRERGFRERRRPLGVPVLQPALHPRAPGPGRDGRLRRARAAHERRAQGADGPRRLRQRPLLRGSPARFCAALDAGTGPDRVPPVPGGAPGPDVPDAWHEPPEAPLAAHVRPPVRAPGLGTPRRRALGLDVPGPGRPDRAGVRRARLRAGAGRLGPRSRSRPVAGAARARRDGAAGGARRVPRGRRRPGTARAPGRRPAAAGPLAAARAGARPAPREPATARAARRRRSGRGGCS